MDRIPAMTDMARSPKEKEEVVEEMSSPAMNVPDYPYGLSICLCNDELEKLNLDTDDVEVGDFVHLHSLAKVTSVSKRDNEATGKDVRVELVLAYISAESEEEEDEESAPTKEKIGRMYKED